MSDRDEIDQALAHEPVILASPGFTARVMRAVREEAAAAAPAPLAFPWHRFLPAFLTAVTLCLATFAAAGWAAEAGVQIDVSERALSALGAGWARGLGIALAAAGGSLLLAWTVIRSASRRPAGM